MNSMDLIVLAAGLGSRFGALKQVQAIDEKGHYILDYSIHDAVDAGFDRIIFVVSKDSEEFIRGEFMDRAREYCYNRGVEFAFVRQDMDPRFQEISPGRTKPLGTAHAVMCCNKKVRGTYVTINADDYYGPETFRVAADFIRNNNNCEYYGCVAFRAGNTLSENGAVKRGICKVVDGNIVEIIESSVERSGPETVNAVPLDGSPAFETTDTVPVSMNMFIMPMDTMDEFLQRYEEFLENMEDPSSAEYLLPDVISEMVSDGIGRLRLIESPETWYGLTYKTDLEPLRDAISGMIASGQYDEDLWKDL